MDQMSKVVAPAWKSAASWVTGRWTLASVMAVAALAVAGPEAGSAQSVARLAVTDEVRLAMSAGPLTVSRDADVYVLGDGGFEREVEGTNGFACMVIRSANDPEVLAPHCFSPDAVETVLPAKIEEGRLQVAGHTQEEVDRQLLDRFEAGSLPLPEGNAYAYMLSSGQQLGPAGKWKPHFMLYLPYATNEQVGGSPDATAFPFVGPVVNHPHSTMVIVMTEFVDPDDITPPSGR